MLLLIHTKLFLLLCSNKPSTSVLGSEVNQHCVLESRAPGQVRLWVRESQKSSVKVSHTESACTNRKCPVRVFALWSFPPLCLPAPPLLAALLSAAAAGPEPPAAARSAADTDDTAGSGAPPRYLQGGVHLRRKRSVNHETTTGLLIY